MRDFVNISLIDSIIKEAETAGIHLFFSNFAKTKRVILCCFILKYYLKYA